MNILIFRLFISGLLITVFGLLGVFIVLIVYHLIERYIVHKYQVIPLNSTDKNCFFDFNSNRCNIMSLVILERCDERHMRKFFSEKLSNDWSRMRSKVVKVLDSYYFKEMDGEEL